MKTDMMTKKLPPSVSSTLTSPRPAAATGYATIHQQNMRRSRLPVPRGTGHTLRKNLRKGKHRFRRLVTLVIKIRRLFDRPKQPNLSQQENILFFMNIATGSGSEEGQGDSRSDTRASSRVSVVSQASYKPVKEPSVPLMVREVLQLRTRTQEDIAMLMHYLRSFSRFSVYPVQVQVDICKKAWYDRFDNGRLVVREGNKAEIYYLLLSGVATSRTAECPDSRRRQRAMFLRRGDTVGETTILRKQKREATVITKESLEVLAVHAKDFLAAHNIQESPESEEVKFLRTVEELSDFPIELLTGHQLCEVQYFEENSTVCPDSNNSEWIYVIRKGQCNVLPGHRIRASASDSSLASSLLPALPDSNAPGDIKRSLPRRTVSTGHLPPIHPAEHYLITQSPMMQPDSGSSPRPDINHAAINADMQKQRVIDTLNPGSVFGLQSLLYKDMTSLSLVSCNAEVVVISKRFLTGYLDTIVLHKLKQKIAPLPGSSLPPVHQHRSPRLGKNHVRRKVTKSH